MKFWEVRPLSKAAIKQAVKLAKTMTAYETAKKKMPLKLVIQFCDILDITEEAEPFDAKIHWPKPRRFSLANRSFSRLVQFESAYFGPKIEASRYTDHEPKWLRSLSDRISDRQIEESNFPVPRFSVTLDGKLLDSKPMDNERPPLVFDRPSGNWLPFTGTLREWQDALAITAEEAALCCIRPTEYKNSVNAVQQPAAKGDAGHSPERGPLLTVDYSESDNSLPMLMVDYPDPYNWLPKRLWPAVMRATPNSYATVGVKATLRQLKHCWLRHDGVQQPAATSLTPSEFALLQQDKRDGLRVIQEELEKLETTPASGKPMPKTCATRLTPSEIESLRKDKRESSEKMLELFNQQDTRLTPSEIASLRQEMRESLAEMREMDKRDAASGNKLMRIRVKIDGVDVPMMTVDAGCDVPDLWLFGKSPVRVGAVLNYRGKDYRVTKCERCKITSASWRNFSKLLVGYRIVSLGVNKKTGRVRPPRKSGGGKP